MVGNQLMRSLQRTLAVSLLVLCGILAGYLGYHITHRPSLIALDSALAAQPPAAASGPASGAAFPAGAPAPAAAQPAGPAAKSAPADASGAPTKAPAVPETLPDVRMPDLSGTERSLHDYLGHPLVINFWATWCEPCRREMPLLQQLWTQYRSTGLDVVGIAVDSRAAVQQYLRTTHVGYPLLVGEDEGSAAVARFGIEPVLPFSVFADAQGRIVAVKIGELHRDDANFIIAAVEQVTRGRESLPQARAAIAAELRQLAIQRAKQAAQPGGGA